MIEIVIGSLIFSTAINFVLIWYLSIRLSGLEQYRKYFDENLMKLEFKIEDFEDRLIEPYKPAKPNNWDSLNQIFKKPGRVKIDESD